MTPIQQERIDDEIFTKQWLYICLLCVLTFGFIQLVLFVALVFCIAIYGMSKCLMDPRDHHEQFNHIKPIYLWHFIDEGLFSLLDEEDDLNAGVDPEEADRYQRLETYSNADRELACDMLSEKAF